MSDYKWEVWYKHAVTKEWYSEDVRKYHIYSEADIYAKQLKREGLEVEIRQI